MTRYAWIFLNVFFFVSSGAGALDLDSGAYGDIADYLNSIYGVDNNAGLSAFPVLNVPMGGRSEGMAGSFAAAADDVSFIDYNPAASSMLNRSELAFFHNNWIADTKLEGLAFNSRLGNLGLAAGAKWLYTPFTEYNLYGDRVSKGYYSEAAAALNASYNFLAGYYFSGISLGASLKGALRLVPDYSSADDDGDIQGEPISGSGASQSAAMAMADLGLLTRFNFLKAYSSRENNFSLALALRNAGPPVMGDPLPTSVTAALAYKPLRPLLFAFDFFLPLNLADFSLAEKPYWSAGLSVAAASFLSMRAGLLAKAGNVRITLGSSIILDRMALELNYTLDLLTQLQPLNRLSLGLRFDLGDQGRQALSDKVDSLYLAGLEAYSREDYAGARSLWEEALALNPRFDPAREGLASLRHTMEVRERIDQMQRLDF
jgi:hypothetical protein